MHRPFSSHARFFSSLDQVESRLESEKPLPIESNPSPLTSSPLFLDYPNPDSAQTGQSSGAAVDFFSAAQGEEEGEEDGEEDEIEKLVSLLGLSMEESCGGCSFDGFYSKVVGMKGPKCEEERRRLDGWIGCYYYGRHGRREPARLAHLLLGKAACCLEEDGGDGDGDGDGGIGFPGTVKEFLEHDPPPLMEEEE